LVSCELVNLAVRYKKDDKIYALKYINKEKTLRKGVTDNIIQERQLLEKVNDSPFICNMRFAFQDSEHMFMVMDLM
jgi:serine/threonine kinase 32